MNIKEAKDEIKRTLKAYTGLGKATAHPIPVSKQRPILMIGPPGIGKTAIMEQIAQECGAGLVSYTMRIITSLEAWKQESHSLKIQGRGGTDFTPVFSYVEKLQKEKQINHLKGLLYFTDGDGVYPQKQTSYETAFVFSDRKFLDLNVPKWIIPLCFDNSPIHP